MNLCSQAQVVFVFVFWIFQGAFLHHEHFLHPWVYWSFRELHREVLYWHYLFPCVPWSFLRYRHPSFREYDAFYFLSVPQKSPWYCGDLHLIRVISREVYGGECCPWVSTTVVIEWEKWKSNTFIVLDFRDLQIFCLCGSLLGK